MSTGAPLNLPKPKAATNNGQDMIELGNSLQKINDAIGINNASISKIGGIETRSGVEGVWFSVASNSSYLLLTQRRSGTPTNAGLYAIRTGSTGGPVVSPLFPSADGAVSIEAVSGSGVRVVSTIYSQAVNLIRLS